jgi:endo-1,4-beta-mannosidase
MVRDLKEVNYYPAADGWTYMWSRFDPTAIDRDFARIRALDANTVRIVIQPSVFRFPTVRPVMADRLSEVVGLAARHSLRVHLTLFDWWHQYTDIDGSKEWASSLLSRYRGDPRIAVVELQNEVSPQNPEVVAWARTMLPYLSTVLPGTLRTVSIAAVPPDVFALFTHELKNSPPDFWDYHYYGPPGDAYSLLSSIKALAAPRPLLVGETGYSTDGTPGDQAARDQAQAAYYQAVFTAAAALGLPTPVPWILDDFSPGAIPPGPTADDPAQYDFGLFQLDGTPKPAAAVVRTAFSGKLSTPWQRSTDEPGATFLFEWVFGWEVQGVGQLPRELDAEGSQRASAARRRREAEDPQAGRGRHAPADWTERAPDHRAGPVGAAGTAGARRSRRAVRACLQTLAGLGLWGRLWRGMPRRHGAGRRS